MKPLRNVRNRRLREKVRLYWRHTPDWAVVLVVFGVLYATGLHTEVIGQVQRLVLATGIRNADVPERVEAAALVPTPDFTLADLNGNFTELSSLRGKTVFLNVWATWCPPCLAEMPGIQALYESVDPDKAAFVLLSVDQNGGDKVRKFLEQKEYTFPVYLPMGRIPQAFRAKVLPTTFIISPEGQLLSREEGMANYDTDEVRAFLQGGASAP